MKQGKVWLVGAGPGDIGLFTLKGMEVLSQAEVVVYDSLVGQGVLAKVPSSARLINVGKRADKHTMPQEQINQVLFEEAQKGYRVVRLKGGDPFLFGRGGEELFLRGLYYNEETGNWFKDSIRGKREDAEALGIALAKQMKESDRTRTDKGEAE